MQDEAKALVLCQQKVKQKNLPMEVVDAEFQWCVATRSFARCTKSGDRS
jgi:cell fate regulator YaaT (PSP1 superfamily)